MSGEPERTLRALESEIRELRKRVQELERTSTENQLRASEDRFAAVVNSTSDAVITIDPQGLVTFWNDAARRMFSRASEDMMGKPLTEIMPERFRSHHLRGLEQFFRTGTSTIVGRTVEVAGLRADGTEFPIELTISTWQTEGRHQFAGIIRDITERKAAEDRLRTLALTDLLTGLPNRVLLLDRLEQAVAQAHRNGTLVALLYLDLDDFKYVNDTLGHAAGDMVLLETGLRITRCVRTSDTVARIGGDEFTVLLPQIRRGTEAGIVALKIIRGLLIPFPIGQVRCRVDVSIGITLCPQDGTTAERLLKNADEAMYRAKTEDRSRLRYFSEPAANVD